MKSTIQDTIKKFLNNKSTAQKASYKGFTVGDKVKNTNNKCMHYGSIGNVVKIEELPNNSGFLIHYKVLNNGSTFKVGDVLAKTEDQLTKI